MNPEYVYDAVGKAHQHNERLGWVKDYRRPSLGTVICTGMSVPRNNAEISHAIKSFSISGVLLR